MASAFGPSCGTVGQSIGGVRCHASSVLRFVCPGDAGPDKRRGNCGDGSNAKFHSTLLGSSSDKSSFLRRDAERACRSPACLAVVDAGLPSVNSALDTLLVAPAVPPNRAQCASRNCNANSPWRQPPSRKSPSDLRSSCFHASTQTPLLSPDGDTAKVKIPEQSVRQRDSTTFSALWK